MVGKPNLPAGGDEREEPSGAFRGAGSASPSPGLTALDQEREASLADEGGRSGAVMEGEDFVRQGAGREAAAPASSPWLAYAIAMAALLGLAVLLCRPREDGYRALPPS